MGFITMDECEEYFLPLGERGTLLTTLNYAIPLVPPAIIFYPDIFQTINPPPIHVKKNGKWGFGSNPT
jgi:hypothetical protein